ncbi:MAG: hypothetical protein IMZ69_07115 [Spirochaetes bacterium]|nr:hypothetical protein [Spirochaetota bacterium]
MKSFADISNIDGIYPSVTSKNCSGAGAIDGTPAVAEWVNNFWGWMQTLLNRSGLTPSGVLEAWGAENAFVHGTPGETTMRRTAGQMLTAMQMEFGGPGELALWSRSQAPATVGARVLLLQGQTIPVASYPDLCNAVYCGDGVNNTALVPFYLSSDSGGVTRSTTGTYMTLPDARGVTIRGIDIGATRDPLGATRGGGTPNGSIQQDAMHGHKHPPDSGTNFWGSGGAGTVWAAGASPINAFSTTGSPATDGGVTYEGKVNTAPRLAVETRMINMACYIGIRY